MTAMFVASDHDNNEWGLGRIPQEAQMLTLQCEANTFIHIAFFNTFDKIGVFVRTINLFIHLASEFINDSFGFFSNQPKLYSSHGCTLHESCN